MIKLFNQHNYTIDTSMFSHWLHDKTVTAFEERFANYVGARYAVSFNSATSALFLICDKLINKESAKPTLLIPSIIPQVVPNAIVNAGCDFTFTDDIKWVGNTYIMGKHAEGGYIVDAAQRVIPNIYSNSGLSGSDIMLFSFFPTKPVGSMDGGMVVIDDKALADILRLFSMNGMTAGPNSWERKLVEPGHKMYMNSMQAYIASENLHRLDYKNERLAGIQRVYNKAFGLNNTSLHLYRVNVIDRDYFIKKATTAGITCGVHYAAAHLEEAYGKQDSHCPLSVMEAKTTVSIPFHEKLTVAQVKKVIEFVLENRE